MRRANWLAACEMARNGGKHRATLPNLVAAYAIVQERTAPPYMGIE